MERFKLDKNEALIFAFHYFNIPFVVKDEDRDRYAISIGYVEVDAGAAVLIRYDDRSLAFLHDLSKVEVFEAGQQDRKMEIKRRFREERYPVLRHADVSCLEMSDNALIGEVLEIDSAWGEVLRFAYVNLNKPLLSLDRVYILTGVALDDEDYFYALTSDTGETKYVSAAVPLIGLEKLDLKDYQFIQDRFKAHQVNHITFDLI